MDSVEFEDVRIPVPWGYVVGRWYGNRQVRPILAIHGWQDNLGTWDTLIPLLPSHIGVLCIDLPGHGRSSRYPQGITYHAIDYVPLIIRVMKAYNWQKVSLMGHSLGSLICFIYATLYPRTVDMFVAIDIIVPRYRSSKDLLQSFSMNVEKFLIENERIEKLALEEPPTYSYEQLEEILYKGSFQSVDMENCKYLLNRNIAKSSKYPDKYYLARDGKIKFYVELTLEPKMSLELAKRLRNIPYLVVKGTRSQYINELSDPIIEFLRQSNSHFQFHEIDGTHHVHLNNSKAVAAVISPFINRYRPANLNSWTLDEETTNTIKHNLPPTNVENNLNNKKRGLWNRLKSKL